MQSLDSGYVTAVCRTTDGFALAEADLALRGSGELLGTAQSGFDDLRALGVPFVAVNLEPVFGSIDAYAQCVDEAIERMRRAGQVPEPAPP